MTSGPVICCPVRLYANDYQILKDVAVQVFGAGLDLVTATDVARYRANNPGKTAIAVFAKRWGKELRFPSRAKKAGGKVGAYFVTRFWRAHRWQRQTARVCSDRSTVYLQRPCAATRAAVPDGLVLHLPYVRVQQDCGAPGRQPAGHTQAARLRDADALRYRTCRA